MSCSAWLATLSEGEAAELGALVADMFDFHGSATEGVVRDWIEDHGGERDWERWLWASVEEVEGA